MMKTKQDSRQEQNQNQNEKQDNTTPQIIPAEAVQWRWLAAVIPCYYGKNRNGCMVHYVDGKVQLVQARCERVLEGWMQYYNTTLERVQSLAEELAGTEEGRKLPRVINRNCCILALKAREEQKRNSGTLGYFVMQHIAYVLETDDHGTYIFFNQQHKGIRITQKKASVEQQIQRGQQSLARYVELQYDRQQAEEQLLEKSRKKQQNRKRNPKSEKQEQKQDK